MTRLHVFRSSEIPTAEERRRGRVMDAAIYVSVLVLAFAVAWVVTR